jgi:anti-sigma B factor antagonist
MIQLTRLWWGRDCRTALSRIWKRAGLPAGHAGTLHIIADLRGVDFLDSTGLGALVGSLKRLRMREGSLNLVTSGGRIPKLFQITGLTHAFALHSSVPDAITADQHWQATLAGQGDSARKWCRGNGLL